jgi:hypothetical protein
MRTLVHALFAVALLSAPALADDHYSEGNVTQLSFIRTRPGMFDEYMKYLSTTYQDLLEAQKQAGLVVDYKVYATEPGSPGEPDVILSVTYKNWAAFDGLDDKVEPIVNAAFGGESQANTAAVDREKMRELLGTERIQELLLK